MNRVNVLQLLADLVTASVRYRATTGHVPTHVHVSCHLYLLLPEMRERTELVELSGAQQFHIAGSEAVVDAEDFPPTGYHFRFLDHEDIKTI